MRRVRIVRRHPLIPSAKWTVWVGSVDKGWFGFHLNPLLRGVTYRITSEGSSDDH